MCLSMHDATSGLFMDIVFIDDGNFCRSVTKLTSDKYTLHISLHLCMGYNDCEA